MGGFAAVGSRIGCWLAPAAFILDRLSKAWAVRRLGAGEIVDLWLGMLRFVYVENTGAAFGLLQGRQTALAVVTGLILLGLLVWLVIGRNTLAALPKTGLWLLLGGAAGNLVDRVAYGYVIDFIEVRFIRFPVFNLADTFVCIAFAVLALWILFGGELKRRA